ncbi:MAG: hypothetical protein JXX14_16670, partial [Deltaproteobacteria bacterium]|nr:hypothetical protein [Deltaproteobacteria bacterium]
MIAAAFVGGCGGCTDEAEKQLLQNKPAHISGSDAAILDFEDYTKWGNAAANSSTASHGAHSAVINVNNWTEVTSVSISNLGQTIGDVASVDVMVPYSPMSWGEVKLIVKLPSLGEWYRELGTVSLAGKSAGTFYPASFQIPSDLRQKLKGTYSDLVFTVVINGPSGTYLLDNLAMGLVVDGDTEADTDTSTPPPTANIVSIPNSAEISNVVAAVNAEFTLLERANISGAAQLITCNGDSGGTIGMDATATSIMSVGSMGLAPRSQVNGDVVCAASVNVDATASVSGQVAQNQTFSAPREISLNLSLPWPTSSDRILAPWQTDSVAPGTYNSLIAYQGANATLSSGIYRVKSLQVEPQAVLKIDDSNGPVIVLISDSFAYSGSVVSQSAGDPQLFVGFAGSLVELYSAFKGTLFAPNATVNMAGLPAGEHQGSVFANQLKLHPDARLSYRAFSGWSDLCGSILTGDCNSAGCPPDYVMEDGTCINSKSVNCADAAPENATAEIAQVEITYTDAGGWTNPADCEWNCNTDFDLVNSACISTQLVDCTDAAPQNAISTISQVAINYTTAEGWETPAECEWACNTDYDQAGDTCINTQTVDCTDVAPANATSTVVPIQITYTSAGGWTVPSVCAWSCNTDYAQSGNSCINSQLVDCTDVAPANGTSTIAQVQINYTTPGGWTTPADCAWTCDASYHTEDSTTCVSDTQSVNCTDNAPTNGTSTVVPVEITWTGSG